MAELSAPKKASFLRSPEAGLVLLILIALAIRMAAAMTRGMIQMDETAYMSMAQNLAEGRGLLELSGVNSTYFSPLLPLLISGFAFVTRDFIVAGYAVVALFGALMLIPVFLLAREFAGARAGLLAAALAAVMPLFVEYSSQIYTEGIYTFFLLMGVYFGWMMLKKRRAMCAAAAGTSLGLAYLANPASVFYLFALAVLALVLAAVKGGAARTAKPAGVFVLVFLVFAIPYVAFLHSELGRWTYSGKNVDVNLYDATHNLRLGTIEWDRDLLSLVDDDRQVKVMTLPEDSDLVGFIVTSPVPAARIFAEQSFILYSDLLPLVVPLWLLPLLGLGLFARGWSRDRAAFTGYLLLMVAPVLLVLAMYAHGRFFMPYLAMALVWMGAGWLRLEEWGKETLDDVVAGGGWKTRLRRRVPWLVAAVILLPTMMYAGATVYNPSESTEYREAGEWLKANAGEGQRIMNRESPSAFYSGGTPVFLPYADYQATTRYARHQEIDYAVIGRQMILDWRPGLRPLLEDDSRHPDWRLVHIVRQGTPQEVLIFELI